MLRKFTLATKYVYEIKKKITKIMNKLKFYRKDALRHLKSCNAPRLAHAP